ncbi:MAG: LamG domain-containing protein, partial [Muribaculaceae bacterium]|nr:LamG domain-containing protein [Muribaculaceae bacterium]
TLDWLTDGSDSGDNGDDDVYDGTLNLDGNRFMLIPNSDDFNIPAGGSMSVSVKARLDNVTTQALISNRVRNYAGNNNYDVSGWAMYTVPTTTSLSFNYPGSSWTACHHNRSGHVSTDEWHHFCWVYSATASEFYIDGVQVANPPATLSGSAIPSYADILVGANYVMADYQKFSIDNLNSYVTGNIDDVRIYRDALSAADVNADMKASSPLDGKNIIAAYDFAEIKGTDVTDISGNGHTGTLVGFPAVQRQYSINIVAPEEGTGTLEVFDGENRVLSGRKVTEGTLLTVVATPADTYMLKQITVNGEQIETENYRGSFAISAETTVAALFERDPDAPIEYCEPTGTPGNARYITTINISDSDNNSLDISGNGANGGFTDRTESVFVTKPGCEVKINVTEGAGEWMHEYFYIDYGRDGVFDVDPESAVANNDLVAFNCYSADGKETWKNSVGSTVSNNQKVVNGNIPAFTIPADLPAGDYRARLRVAWCDVNPCSTLADIGTEVGKACIDFTIRIESDELENERTVTVISADTRLGSVAITDPATEENSVKTSQKNVTVEASATDIAAFMNWTDANGEITATTPEFVYSGDSDATFIANFGHTVSLMPVQGGSATITANGNTLKNGTIVTSGTEVTVSATPGQGMMLDCIIINGAEVKVEAGETTYTFAIEENSSIEVIFDSIRYSFSVSASEGGQVEVWESVTGTSEPDGEKINDGDMITASTEAYVFITPAEDYKIASVTVTNGADETDATDETLDWVNANGQYIYPFYGATGNVKITVEFTEKNSINDIIAGFTDGPVEYFNLQGVKVNPENLVPGIYMIRQGSTTAKILMK